MSEYRCGKCRWGATAYTARGMLRAARDHAREGCLRTKPTITEFLLARITEDEQRPECLQPHRQSCNYPGDMPGYCDCGRNAAEVKAIRTICERAAYLAEYGDTSVFGSEVPPPLGRRAPSSHPDYDPAWAIDETITG